MLKKLMDQWHELFSKADEFEQQKLLNMPVLCSNSSANTITEFNNEIGELRAMIENRIETHRVLDDVL